MRVPAHSVANKATQLALLTAAALLVLPAAARAQSFLDTIGLTKLLSVQPSLTGAGVRVGQAEANSSLTGGNNYQVNPIMATQPVSLFTYTDQNGIVSNIFNPSAESSHADTVGSYFYGVGTGVAPGVSHVDNYSAGYFFGTTVFFGEPIPDAVVNQSFAFSQSNNPVAVIVNQESSDTTYDNYIAQYGTIIVSGVGNGAYAYPEAPSTSYNGIAVGVSDGPSAAGPTQDNGRSKPDITAPGGYTSFSTAMVSGAAAILVQAGARGDGGSSSIIKADAVDSRTVKALLLNGADKQSVRFNRTSTAPLDATNGAGLLNIYNSYQQLAGGFQPASSVAATTSVGAAHPADTASAPATSFTGWNFATLNSSLTSDAYANYVFRPAAAGFQTLTATLVWNRQYNLNPAIPLGINNLDLYLYDTTTNKLIDSSVSTVDNVQNLFDLNLTPGDRYDLQVLKTGGRALVSNSETYALAFSLSSTLAVAGTWTSSFGGSASTSANWTGGMPQYAANTANFTGAITAAATVTLGNNWTLGNINFNNTHSYTIAADAAGPLTLDNGGLTATSTITDGGGTHTITAPLQLNSQLAVNVASAADTLNITGNIFDNPTLGGGRLTIGGNGTVVLSGVNSYGNSGIGSATIISSGTLVIAAPAALPAGGNIADNASLVIHAGTSSAPVTTGRISGSGALTVGAVAAPAYLQLSAGSGISSQSSLIINPGSSLDITNNTLLVNYNSAANDPAQTIRTYLLSASNHGLWNGTGLTSSTVQSEVAGVVTHGGGVYAIGYADGSRDAGQSIAVGNQLVYRPALLGDVNLEGAVTFVDLGIVAQNLGDTNADWMQGDMNYDGTVNFLDVALIAQNMSKTILNTPLGAGFSASFKAQWSLAVAETELSVGSVAVPEPATLSILMAEIAGLMMRRRRV
jgi:hypothetical protein